MKKKATLLIVAKVNGNKEKALIRARGNCTESAMATFSLAIAAAIEGIAKIAESAGKDKDWMVYQVLLMASEDVNKKGKLRAPISITHRGNKEKVE